MLAGVAAEVLKRALVRLEELTQSLIGERAEEAAPREPEREHEQVLDHDAVAEPHSGLPPVDLALLTRRRLESPQRPLGLGLQPAKRSHEALHRLVAPGVAALSAQLLEQDPRRVVHRRRPRVEIAGVLGQPRVGLRRAPIRTPLRLRQAPAHRLAVQSESPGQRRDRHSVHRPRPMKFFP